MQGSRGSPARLNVHQTIQPFRSGKDMVPKIPREVFVAPNASVIGSVEIGAHSGVYYGAGTCTGCIRGGCGARGRARLFPPVGRVCSRLCLI